jgi:hypothetical protein
MSQVTDEQPIELHLLSPIQDDRHVELLTAIAHYHRNEESLNLGHTVHFGRPWLPGSTCEFGLISLPYLEGPELEQFVPSDAEPVIRCLWLVPITREERDFKKDLGVEALEQRFEATQFNYADPLRRSVV